MISQAIRSLGYYFKAIPLISELRLWKYVLLSALISLLVAGASFYSSGLIGEFIADFLGSFYKWETGSGIFSSVTKWLTTILTGLSFLFLLRYILLVILAPLMSFLSEEVEEKYTGASLNSGFSFSRTAKEMIRGLRMALRNITRELLFTALFFALGFIPIFTPFSLVAIFLVQAYYAGFGNTDYYLERHMGLRESARTVKQNKGLALGNGSIYLGLLLIPVVGVIFGPVLATISATVHAIEDEL